MKVLVIEHGNISKITKMLYSFAVFLLHTLFGPRHPSGGEDITIY
jgi:hypothetical protein